MSLARGFLSGLSLPQALNVIINIYVILRRRNLFEMGEFDLIASRDLLRWFGGSEFTVILLR